MRPRLHTHSIPACLPSMLTRMPLCRRSLCGRIWESNIIPHIVVGSASRSCGHCRGRARVRRVLARGCGCCVLLCGALRVLVWRASRLCMYFVVAHVCEWSRAPGWIS